MRLYGGETGINVELLRRLRARIGALVLVVPVLVFFFFQAEDGIRDYKVTGVQTCALPIFGSRLRSAEDLAVEEECGDGQPHLFELARGRDVLRPSREPDGESENGNSWKHAGPQKSQLTPPWKARLLTTLADGVRSWLSALAAAPLMSLSFEPNDDALHPAVSPVAAEPDWWIAVASAAPQPLTLLT